ncbi:hypothetical protein TSUD_75590 [Trifolium subterraneum]|nr:hypothetical protein TSUD_75590 [Trifolium subterraneum]
MSRSIQEKKLGTGRVVAVAIENNKTSQYAAKWAVDNLLPKDQHLLLVHVRQKASSIPTTTGNHVPIDGNDDLARAYMQQMDNESKELFASFRVFCNRKNIQCKEILLEDLDISKAIIEGVTTYSIELLVLGSPSKSGLVRRFRTTDVPSLVSKGAPPFCTVYIISKGKISSVKTATSPLPVKSVLRALPPPQQLQSPDRMDLHSLMRNHPPRSSAEKLTQHTSHHQHHQDEIISPFTRGARPTHRSYESTISDSDISFVSSGRPSDEVEAEMRRLRLELKQTMEMYSTACKEALTAKQKAMELQRWKLDEQRKLEDARFSEETALAVAEKEKAKSKVAMEAAEASRKIAELEAQKRVEVLSSIRHPNMVLLLGACPEFGCLVYEHMSNGSLDDCLFRRNNKMPVLPWQLRFRIAAEIATGLLFLHQTKPEPLVHRDLKPGNILLDRNYVSKISDVGLARLVPPSVADTVTQYRMTATAGTFCYIDPEYQQTGMLGTKSDIYSLGIMLLQMITAKPPMGLSHHVSRSIEKGTFREMLDPAVEDWPDTMSESQSMSGMSGYESNSSSSSLGKM